MHPHATNTLRIFGFLNTLVIALSCTMDTRQGALKAPSFVERSLHNYWIFVEAFLVAVFLYGIIAVIRRGLPRIGFWLGVSTFAGYLALYYLDYLSQLSLHARLISADTISHLQKFSSFVGDFAGWGTFSRIAVAGIGFGLLQIAFFWLASWLAHRDSQDTQDAPEEAHAQKYRRLLIATSTIAACGVLIIAMRNPTHVATVYRQDPGQHPLGITGLVDWLMPPMTLFDDGEELRFEQRLLQIGDNLAQLRNDYANFRITPPADVPPDIVIIMAESLRFDAFNQTNAPQLSEFQSNCIVGERHFSGGNATLYGLFCLLSGLDASLTENGRDWPMALPRVMKQSGYLTAFLASGPFEWLEMTDFLKPSDWDVYNDDHQEPLFYKRDEAFVSQAAELLARRGEASGHKGPVCVVMLPYTTHWDYHFDPELDAVCQPVVQGDLPWPPRPRYDRQALRNRYDNSIHAFDRIYGPLLSKNRIVIVIGDHGEAIFDYEDQLVHSHSLSEVQFRTPLLINVPGQDPRRLSEVTFHIDILPTLLSAIGVSSTEKMPLHGISLLDASIPTSRHHMVCNAINGRCGLVAPYEVEQAGDPSEPNLQLVQANLNLFGPEIESITAHDKSGDFVQTLGGRREPFENAFWKWIETITEHSVDMTASVNANLCAGLRSALRSHQLYALDAASKVTLPSVELIGELKAVAECDDVELARMAKEVLQMLPHTPSEPLPNSSGVD